MAFSFVAFVLLIDAYSWQGVRQLIRHKPARYKKAVFYIFWSITVLIILNLLLSFIFPGIQTGLKYRIYTSGVFFILYLSKLVFCIFLLLEDVVRLFKWIFFKSFLREAISDTTHDNAEHEIPGNEYIEEETVPEPLRMTRSQFISRAALLTSAVPFIVLTRGMVKGAYNYKVRRVQLCLPHLPEVFEGLKILQISDVHSGSFTDKDAVYRGIQMIQNEQADVVFFTGDLVNNRTDEFYPWQDLFAEIKAPMGVFSTFGNHDYGDYVSDWPSPEAKIKNLADLASAHKDMSWNLMRNEHALIEKQGKKLAIIGVENWGDRGRFQKFGNIEKAMYHMPDAPVKLLLSHDPSHFDTIVSKQHPDIDVTFSGHTHGFQFGVELGSFKWSPSQYIYPHWAGLYRAGSQQLYVNRGFGFLGYPGRVGIMPEISVFTLTKYT